MLDGVDEVPEEHSAEGKTVYPLHALLSGLADALPPWQRSGNRILVTSRPYGLRPPGQRDRLRLSEVGVLPLDEDLQHLFVARWYAAADHAHWEQYAAGLAEEVGRREELGALRRNPLLLTALCVKYKEGKPGRMGKARRAHQRDSRRNKWTTVASRLPERVTSSPSSPNTAARY